MGKEYISVCLFLPSGRTFTFRNVCIECDNETSLVLRYTAMSDGQKKVAVIQKSQIVGWSTLDG